MARVILSIAQFFCLPNSDEYEIKKEGEPKMESEPKKESAPVIATLSVEDQINTSLFESVKLKLTKFVNSEDTYRVHLEILSQV